MSAEFQGKTILITGGGTGIGKGCAEYFLARGAVVTIAGPEAAVLEKAANQLKEKVGSHTIRTALCDVTEEDQVEHAVAVAAGDGNLDIMLANAGTSAPGPIQLLTKKHWHFAYDVNVVGTALCFKHAGLVMKRHGGGVMIGISSVEALRASYFHATYNVTKAALDSLIPASAREFGPFNIRVNGIRPGLILTEAVLRGLNEEIREKGVRQTFLGRAGTPLDIAKAVAFFASDQAEWITGQVLNVCGGLTVHKGDNFEGIARHVFSAEEIEQSKPQR